MGSGWRSRDGCRIQGVAGVGVAENSRGKKKRDGAAFLVIVQRLSSLFVPASAGGVGVWQEEGVGTAGDGGGQGHGR